MLCDRCKKRDAKIYYTEVVNGEMKEQHLCEECAAECTQFHMNSTFVNKDISIGDILSSILGTYRTNTNQKAEQGKNGNTEETTKEKKTDHTLHCENCGMTYEQFLKEGKFGCHECYHYFHKILSRSLKSLHGADTHVGKHPKGYVSDMNRIINELSEIEKMSILLQEAIEKEEFEEAARLRDAIRALKKKERETQQDHTQSKKDEENKEEINNA